MFCCSLPCLVGAAVVFAGLSYVAYIPLMEGIVDTCQVRIISTFARVVRITGGVAEGLGVETPDNVARMLTSLILSDKIPPPDTDQLKVEDYTFDGVPVRLYRPTSAANPSPSVIYIHGGGWTILNVAAVALKLFEVKDIPKLRFQWLIYPALQAFSFKTPSYVSNEEASPYFLQGKTIARYWCNYMDINTPTMIEAFSTNNHTSRKLKQSIYASYVSSKLLPTTYHGDNSEQISIDHGDDNISNQIEKIILNPYFAPLMSPDLSGVAPAFVSE